LFRRSEDLSGSLRELREDGRGGGKRRREGEVGEDESLDM
jgi:hypothetical protein